MQRYNKTNSSRSLDMQISLQLKDRPQQFGIPNSKETASTKEMLIETMKRIVKFILESNPQWNVAKDVGYS